MCELRKFTCGQRVVRAPLSNCQTTKFCDADCGKVGGRNMKTVCGSDELFYKSECQMKKDNCGYDLFSKNCFG